jgi:threonine dehydratase
MKINDSATPSAAIAADPAELPTFHDVLSARARIAPHLPRTPMFEYPSLDAVVGARIFVKHENAQPTGAFKVRGGLNLVSRLSTDTARCGVIAYSTGNHGQSIAYASRMFGIPAHIVMPEAANPSKVSALRALGAEVVLHGASFEHARRHAEDLARARGHRLISAGNEPLLIAGVATEALEMLEDEPELDAIIVPVGSGSGAAGACLVASAIAPSCRVIAVQSQASPAGHDSWRCGRCVESENSTFAEGLATGAGSELPQRILGEHLSDFVLVSDDEIKQAMVWMMERAHTLAEGAGAAALAAAYKLRDALRHRKVGIVCSGGNSSLRHVELALAFRRELDQAAVATAMQT